MTLWPFDRKTICPSEYRSLIWVPRAGFSFWKPGNNKIYIFITLILIWILFNIEYFYSMICYLSKWRILVFSEWWESNIVYRDFSSNGVSCKRQQDFETISCHFYFTHIFPFENVENIIWIWKVLHRIWKTLQWNPKSGA